VPTTVRDKASNVGIRISSHRLPTSFRQAAVCRAALNSQIPLSYSVLYNQVEHTRSRPPDFSFFIFFFYLKKKNEQGTWLSAAIGSSPAGKVTSHPSSFMFIAFLDSSIREEEEENEYQLTERSESKLRRPVQSLKKGERCCAQLRSTRTGNEGRQ
jgi:hypothetical protein